MITTGADELLGHQTLNDQGCIDASSTNMTAAEDLLGIDEALGLLDPLALDELQILADCHVFADAATEDSLRDE